MLGSHPFCRCLVCAALLCFAAVAGAAQEKDTPSSPPSTAAAATSSSDAAPFEVAPGVPLPAHGMVWILDQAENKPRLDRIYLDHVHVNGHTVENVIRAQFLVLRMGATIDLPGTTAKLRVNSHTPVIFVRKSQEEEEEEQSARNPDNVREHFILLRLHVTDNKRVVCTFTAWEFGLKRDRQQDTVQSTIEEIDDGQWLKITPNQPLPDGEYAAVDMPDNKKYFESNVYDFGVGSPTITTVKPASY